MSLTPLPSATVAVPAIAVSAKSEPFPIPILPNVSLTFAACLPQCLSMNFARPVPSSNCFGLKIASSTVFLIVFVPDSAASLADSVACFKLFAFTWLNVPLIVSTVFLNIPAFSPSVAADLNLLILSLRASVKPFVAFLDFARSKAPPATRTPN